MHNLKFSTDPNPSKCKTKCLAFLKKERPLPSLYLCGDALPWVSEGLHHGNTVTNKYDGMRQDIRVKRGCFVQKNCELQQEFYFAHPATKFNLNVIYNSNMTGSPLWDLFCKEAVMLENSWNVSFRHMFSLPLQTHRYLVEPVSGQTHLKTVLVKHFLSFIRQIKEGPKDIVKHILKTIQHDVRSTTGNNLRNIMLVTGNTSISHLTIHDACKIKYHPISEDNQWRVGVINDIIDVIHSSKQIEYMERSELLEILQYACVT